VADNVSTMLTSLSVNPSRNPRPYVATATNEFGVVLLGRPWQESAGSVLPGWV
jgi:hypothetical protein